MMAQRSLFRPDQLDSNGSYEFAQLVIDGYSGGDLQDGYLTGLVFQDRANGGATRLEIHSDDGEINQTGSGNVTLTGNVEMKANAIVQGDFTVNGTTTYINTEQMQVTDPITIVNVGGSEGTSDWSGLSVQDTDGYNRIGWNFDGYWGISSGFNADSDLSPDRAIAFIGAGDSNGDLSSTTDGDSGADKIGVTTIAGVTGNDVQTVLESLDGAIDQNASDISTNAGNIATNAGNISTNAGNISQNASDIAQNAADIAALEEGTPNLQWTINNDATTSDEDPCLIMSGGDGSSIIDGYLCVITDSVGGDRFQFQLYEGGSAQATDLHLGTASAVTSGDATLTFNAGNGVDAYQATIALDGDGSDQGELIYTAIDHNFSGDIFAQNDLTVDGYATLGNSSDDHLVVNATIYSDLNPDDCTYQLGDDTNRWIDGYFCFPRHQSPTNYTPVGSSNSLEGHLRGIDTALSAVSLQPERGVYEITVAEATADELVSSRTVDQGVAVDVSGLTDASFRDNIYVYLNGQLLYNDPTPSADSASVQNDVARKTGSLGTLVFAANIRPGAIIQIVDMT